MRFMPYWEELELEELRTLLFNHLLTMEQLALRFRAFGGVPRLVLVQLDLDPSSFIETLVTPVTALQLYSVLGSRSFRADFSHHLGHYHVSDKQCVQLIFVVEMYSRATVSWWRCIVGPLLLYLKQLSFEVTGLLRLTPSTAPKIASKQDTKPLRKPLRIFLPLSCHSAL